MVRRLTSVERPQPTLRFQYGDALPVAAIVALFLQRRPLGVRVGEKQQVGHVLTPRARGRGLAKVQILPVEQSQNLEDNFVFGDRLVQNAFAGIRTKHCSQLSNEGSDSTVVQRLPHRRLAYAVKQEILGKELADHVIVGAVPQWISECAILPAKTVGVMVNKTESPHRLIG